MRTLILYISILYLSWYRYRYLVVVVVVVGGCRRRQVAKKKKEEGRRRRNWTELKLKSRNSRRRVFFKSFILYPRLILSYHMYSFQNEVAKTKLGFKLKLKLGGCHRRQRCWSQSWLGSGYYLLPLSFYSIWFWLTVILCLLTVDSWSDLIWLTVIVVSSLDYWYLIPDLMYEELYICMYFCIFCIISELE